MPNIRLIGASVYADSPAPFFCDTFEKAPFTDDPVYYDWLLGVVRKHGVDLLIPGIEADVFSWNRNRGLFRSSAVRVALNNPILVELCQDKWLFYQELVRHCATIAIPTILGGSFEDIAAKLAVPFLLKPRQGSGGKGIVKVADLQSFNQHRELLGRHYMAQRLVGADDDEYTVSGFFDSQSRLCCSMCMRRHLSPQGSTDTAEVVPHQDVEPILTRLAAVFHPVGPTNFQFRRAGGEYKLLEINPRFSSATSIRAAFGYNESAMAVLYFLEDIAPAVPNIRFGKAVRYLEDLIRYDRADF